MMNDQRSTINGTTEPQSQGRVRTPALPANPLLGAGCSLPVERRQRRRAAFTLIELLVVISIIVILIAILLPALSKIVAEAHSAATQEQLSSISSACMSYEAVFKAYPGPFSEADISNHNITDAGGYTITGTQNMLIGLMGTMYISNARNNPGSTPVGGMTGGNNTFYDTLTGSTSGGGTVYVGNPLGSTVIDYANGGVQTASFLSPQAVDLLPEPPSLVTTDPFPTNPGYGNNVPVLWLPTLYDDFPDGLPILYYRRNIATPGTAQQPVSLNSGTAAAYYLGDNQAYTDSATLQSKTGKVFPQNYGTEIQSCYDSLATGPAGSALNAFAATVDNQSAISAFTPATANTAGFAVQGDFMLISAGADHIYGYNNYSNGALITTVPQSDDVVVFGGQ